MSPPLDVEKECIPHFPSLRSGYLFADNAGGSQCCQEVINRITDYLINSNVQLGAEYSVSVTATKRTLVDAPRTTAALINAASEEEISFGSSSTMLAENLARGLEPGIAENDEFVVSYGDHETNVGPWIRLASRKNAKVIPWIPRIAPTASSSNPFAVELVISDLENLITSRTRLVSFTACSNILGAWTNPKKVIEAVRRLCTEKAAAKVEVVVDCVAYAPHRRIDVQDRDVDYCFFSYYKAYGPHTSILYTRKTSLESSITSLAHYFLKTLKLQPGGIGYELTYSTTGVYPYLLSLSTPGAQDESTALNTSFDRIAIHEQTIMQPLINYLLDKWDKGVRIVGPESWSKDVRAPTISFVIVDADGKTKKLGSAEVVRRFDAKGKIGIRYGHFYSHRLLELLGMDPDDGVIRISLVHYNTIQDVKLLISVLEEVLGV
ncbi:hypothetical protein FRC02_003434 [Tulasnella sp. 418]|nr:hypothetical protein FRC02_003434 [Tulasnella sp. 418]